MIELEDSEMLPLSIEHNFWTWSVQKKVQPIPVTRSKGVFFWDEKGKRYLDFNCASCPLPGLEWPPNPAQRSERS
jgi:taurine--2-oxoglutarate transaminase